MTANGWFQIGLFLAVVLALTRPLGAYMARVFQGERTFLDPVMRPVERVIYRLTGVDRESEMKWTEYAVAMLLFSAVSMALLYAIQRLQLWLPWNPQHFVNVPADLSFNTAASFTTNTNWQNYSGETTMSYFTQMAGLAYHNFASAAAGIAMAIALIRGIARRESNTIGNFWVDLTRASLWVLLPVCFVVALFFVSQGMIQNLKPYTTAQLDGPADGFRLRARTAKRTQQQVKQQVIAQGPLASQEAIKMYGTNGGGFFNANSAHPFENPTSADKFFADRCDFCDRERPYVHAGAHDGLAAPWLGSVGRDGGAFRGRRILHLCGGSRAAIPELRGVDQQVSATQSGGNMEGKEVRFGIANSALFATVTTDASCGAVNGVSRFVYSARRHDSADQHDVWRSCIWRRGIGNVRDDCICDSLGLYRGADGGTHSGISGQENRSV